MKEEKTNKFKEHIKRIKKYEEDFGKSETLKGIKSLKKEWTMNIFEN